jgi:hypothetical protein
MVPSATAAPGAAADLRQRLAGGAQRGAAANRDPQTAGQARVAAHVTHPDAARRQAVAHRLRSRRSGAAREQEVGLGRQHGKAGRRQHLPPLRPSRGHHRDPPPRRRQSRQRRAAGHHAGVAEVVGQLGLEQLGHQPRVGEQVSDAQTGKRPRLGEGAQQD